MNLTTQVGNPPTPPATSPPHVHHYHNDTTMATRSQTGATVSDFFMTTTDLKESIPHETDFNKDQQLLMILQNLVFWYCLFLVVSGTIGNILSILVFSRKSFRATPMSVYARFMAVNDLAALYTGPVYYFLLVCLDIDINLYSDILCRTHLYRMILFTDSSAYTIISLTSERLFCVLLPHKVRLFCTKSTAQYVTAVIFVVLAVVNFPLILWSHVTEDLDSVSNRTEPLRCRFEADPLYSQAWYAFDLVKFCVAPLSFITISNIVLLVQLYGRSLCGKGDFTEAEVKRRAHNNRQKSMTLMLISVSVVYLVCNLPVVLLPYNLLNLSTPGEHQLNEITSDLFMFTNNIFNFLLYCACGTRFRQELVSMFCADTGRKASLSA